MQQNSYDTAQLPSSVDTTAIINKETFVPPDPLIYITEPRTTPSMCSLITNATHHHARMRFVVFQRDTGDDLYNLITYYTQVVPLDSLVVIDHQGVEKATQEILSYYGNLGMHVWRCEGDFENKAKMWSHVTSVYSQSSDFVFPIDADEYLAILSHEKEQGFVMKWDQPAFEEAVEAKMNQTLDGKTFKSIQGRVIPGECSINSESSQLQYPSFRTPACTVSHAVIDNRMDTAASICMAKAFTKGKDFSGTDKGNHHAGKPENHKRCMEHLKNPATKSNPFVAGKPENHKRCMEHLKNPATKSNPFVAGKPENHKRCMEHLKNPATKSNPFVAGKPENHKRCMEHLKNPATKSNPFVATNFVLLHMQDLTFSAWMSHFIRGASSSGFNKFGDDFEKMKACRHGAGIHYCRTWVEMVGKNFSYWEMKKQYHHEQCLVPDDPHFTVVPLKDIFHSVCSA
eukprot:CAMPEP_0178766504 /NCGR_PEP_ID=MMETSP0744-20121128/19105_1 /TAXON_ID=913974 /ORGANISM="Nitzschia punctata, Strain CCMP561" /LENGTH=456 /DNA_ID=CAMNT_0020422241 /DNA_START=208 /DNA_END=1578 /DNA_ORIENTATION=-